MFYCYDKLLSRNCVFNMVVGVRGHGKTFNAKTRGIKNFIKKGEQTVWVRRYKTEIEQFPEFFFDSEIKEMFPGHEFKASKKFGFIDNKVAFIFIPLSTANNQKSNSYPNVTQIVFDEFIIDKRSQRYLSNDVDLFMNLCETVIRRRDNCIIIMLANNVTINNPYFKYFKIFPTFKSGFKVYYDNLICLEMDDNDKEYTDNKKSTRWGKLISQTNFGKHALENEELTDNKAFILDSKPKNRQFVFSIKYLTNNLGFWYCPDLDIYYVDNTIVKTSKLQYALTKNDMEGDFQMLEKCSKSICVYQFKNYFKLGKIGFKDKYVKDSVYDILKIIGIK